MLPKCSDLAFWTPLGPDPGSILKNMSPGAQNLDSGGLQAQVLDATYALPVFRLQILYTSAPRSSIPCASYTLSTCHDRRRGRHLQHSVGRSQSPAQRRLKYVSQHGYITRVIRSEVQEVYAARLENSSKQLKPTRGSKRPAEGEYPRRGGEASEKTHGLKVTIIIIIIIIIINIIII